MAQDAGWIWLVDPATQRVRARAHLLVNEITPGGWQGHLQTMKTDPAGGAPADGYYLARFGRCAETHLVEVTVSGGDARVRCDEAIGPSVLRELSDGE